MITFKHFNRRSLARERADNLSVVTAGPVRILGRNRKSGLNSVRRVGYKENPDIKLLAHFRQARANALLSLKQTNNVNADKNAPPQAASTSSYFNAPQPLNFNSLQNEDQQEGSMGNTMNHQFVSPAPSKGSRVGPPTSVATQSLVGARMHSETEYWSSFTSSGRARRNLGLKPLTPSMSVQTPLPATRSVSSWGVIAGLPMTREDAMEVQQEMASLAATRIVPRENMFGPGEQNQRTAAHQIPGTVRKPLQWMLNTVQPPLASTNGEINCVNAAGQMQTPTFNNAGDFVGCVLQGNWATRDNLVHGRVPTKQYSIAQLLDIFTGEAVPPTSEIAGYVFNPMETPLVEDVVPVERQGEADPAHSIEVESLNGHRKKSEKKKRRKSKTRVTRPLHEINQEWGIGLENHHKSDAFVLNPIEQEPILGPSSDVSKKSVSFLTDSCNNIAVDTFHFDKFTQEYLSGSAPSTSNFMQQDKENQGYFEGTDMLQFFAPIPSQSSHQHIQLSSEPQLQLLSTQNQQFQLFQPPHASPPPFQVSQSPLSEFFGMPASQQLNQQLNCQLNNYPFSNPNGFNVMWGTPTTALSSTNESPQDQESPYFSCSSQQSASKW